MSLLFDTLQNIHTSLDGIIMSELSISILNTLIAIVAGILLSLVGIIYRKLLNRIENLENSVADIEKVILEIKRDMDTTHGWMFGREEDDTNEGVSKKINNIHDRLNTLVDVLHDENELDMNRDDVDD